jgi:hypothetical protein
MAICCGVADKREGIPAKAAMQFTWAAELIDANRIPARE